MICKVLLKSLTKTILLINFNKRFHLIPPKNSSKKFRKSLNILMRNRKNSTNYFNLTSELTSCTDPLTDLRNSIPINSSQTNGIKFMLLNGNPILAHFIISRIRRFLRFKQRVSLFLCTVDPSVQKQVKSILLEASSSQIISTRLLNWFKDGKRNNYLLKELVTCIPKEQIIV